MNVPGNKVLLLLWLVGAAAICLTGFVTHAPNRLVSGEPLPLWTVAGPAALGLFAALGAVLIVAAFLAPNRTPHFAVGVAAAMLLLLALAIAGEAATALLVPDHPAARTSLGPAFWIVELAATLIIVDAVQRRRTGPLMRLLVALVVSGAVGLLMVSGRLDALSILREFATHRDTFAVEFGRHCLLVLAALVPAVVIGAPLGVAAARRAGLRQGVFAVLNVVQTIPSVAVFGLLIAPLSALAARVPALAALGVQGIGAAPAIFALIMYALLPVVRNTEAGISGVDPAVVDAANGMGFTPRQVFWRVEVPLAMPVVLAGVRVVLVQTIGLAAVAALIGAGGLGAFIFQGLGQYAVDLILLGAVPTILLALAADLVMRTAIDLAGGTGRTS
ncbi:MAG TPA: ABC transporter permease [Alphaproteobacteria bacterium]